jgi:HTH-type transcriptional regulator, competence development regulator
MKNENCETSEFGAFLKRLRERRGLNLRQVEIKSGVSHSYLSQMENHGNIPSAQVLAKLAPVYRVDVTVLLQEAAIMPKKTDGKTPLDEHGGHELMPPALKELTEDELLMERFDISSFEITRLAEFNYRRGARLGKQEFLLLILFLRQLQA